jgi:hypothetical protein
VSKKVAFEGSVKTKADRVRFFEAVGAALGGMAGFHPDTSFSDYVYVGKERRGERVFSDAEARRLDALMEQSFGVPGDPYGVAVSLMERERKLEAAVEKKPQKTRRR